MLNGVKKSGEEADVKMLRHHPQTGWAAVHGIKLVKVGKGHCIIIPPQLSLSSLI